MKIVPNTQHCVQCSTESKVSAIPVIHHKTGNEIQIVSDPEVAAEFHKLSSRAGFGTLRGMKPGHSGGSSAKISCRPATFVETHADEKTYEEFGKRVMTTFDIFGKEKALKLIRESVDSRFISKYQGGKLISILNALTKQPEQCIESVISYKPKNDRVTSIVSDEITETFKNWKRH